MIRAKQSLNGKVNDAYSLSGKALSDAKLSGRTSVGSVLKGEDGATFIPEVDADGTLRWTNDKNLPNPEPVNIKGPPVIAKVDNGVLIIE